MMMSDAASDATPRPRRKRARKRARKPKRVYAPETNTGRWTVRDVPEPDRAAAVDAAKRRDVSLGVWLSEAIRAYVAAEREPVGEVLAPQRALPPLSLEDIARAVEIAARIKEIRGKPPMRILGRVTRLLADRLAG